MDGGRLQGRRRHDSLDGEGSEYLDDSMEGGNSESLEHFLEHILESRAGTLTWM